MRGDEAPPRPSWAAGDDAPIGRPTRTARRAGWPLSAILVSIALGAVATGTIGYLLGTSGRTDPGTPDSARAVATPASTASASATTAPVVTVPVVTVPVVAVPTTVPRPAPTVPSLSEDDARTNLAEIDVTAIGFQAGTTELTADGQATVASLGEVLARTDGIPVELVVRTYTQPTPGHNHGLSIQQADMLATQLADTGVPAETIAAVGRGASITDEQLRPDDVVRFDSDDATVAALDSSALTFEDGTAQPSAAVRAVMDDVANMLAANPQASLTIIVYVDARVDADTDHDLSHDRGDLLIDMLVGEGIDRDRLDVIGFGGIPVAIDVDNAVTVEIGEPAALPVAIGGIDNTIVDFEPGTTTFAVTAAPILDALADAIGSDPGPTVIVEAHTYTETTAESNLDLSTLQGEAVVTALVQRGVDESRLQTVGHGDPPHFALPGRTSYITLTVDRS